MNPHISVIIPAHNEEGYLPGTLEALSHQTYPFFESIVVANGCSDHTDRAARDGRAKLLEIDVKSLGRARNLGAKKAGGELLIFLDADTQLEPNALEVIAEKFTRVYAMGTLKGKPDSAKLAYRGMYFLKNLLHKSGGHYGSSGVMICWKDHFKAVGGFDEALQIRENSDLLRKLRPYGCYGYIGHTVATTSMRRYEFNGFARMAGFWFRLWLLSFVSDLRHRAYETVR